MPKISILTSHVIQYQTPFFKKLAEKADLKVYFCWDFGMKKTYDPEFRKEISWDIPLLEGFSWRLLRNLSLSPSSAFWGKINPGIILSLARDNPDALLLYGWNGITEWMAIFASWILRIPIIIHSESPVGQEVKKKKWLLIIKKIVLGFLFRIMKAAVFIGEENKKFYEFYGVPSRKLFFSPYSVDNERLRNSSTEDMRNGLNLDKEDVVILFTGKLIYKKRPMDLLRAYEKLDFQKKALVFVGDGELRGELEQYVKSKNINKVVFVGFQNQTELPNWYAMSDIFVLPSGEGETWGLVVNEAMNFGLPIVVSDVVGCGPDLVRSGDNGFIFKLGDVDALVGALSKLTDKNMRDKFGRESLEIIKYYSYEKEVDGVLEAIK